MEVKMWPTQVRAVRAAGAIHSCLVFTETGNEIWLCFDRDNLHVVQYLRGELSMLESLLGLAQDPQS